MIGFCEIWPGFGFATVWRIVSCGVLGPRTLEGFEDEACSLGEGCRAGGRISDIVCHGLLALAAVGGVEVGVFLEICGTALPDCCIRLRSFCDSFGAPRLNELGVAGMLCLAPARLCDSVEVRFVDA